MFRRAPNRRLRAAPLIALAALAIAAPSAHAHAAFLGATPPPGARVETAPAAVTLRFTETLNRRLSDAHLVNAASGRRVPGVQSAAGLDGLRLSPTAPLRRGAYRVEWHTVSTTDGHELEGSFGFGVRVAAAGGGRAIEQSPLADLGWVRALVHALLYAMLLPFAGALFLTALLGRDWLVPASIVADGEPTGLDPGAARRRARGLIADLGLFAAALAAAVALVDTARAAGGLSPGDLRDFLLANVSGVGRVAAVALVALAAVLARRRPRAAALAAIGALGAVVASGHANSAPDRALAIVADWVHLLGAAVWVGGIALIALAWAPALRRGAGARLAVARHVLAPFGRVALPAFLVVVVAGIVNAAVELGSVPDLWETAYGRVLLVKIALVGAIAAASYGHALRLRPRLLAANPHPSAVLDRRHWLLVRAEPLLGLGVVTAVGVLTAFPLPPRQLDDATSGARTAVPACSPCPLPTPAADELSVAGQGGSMVAAAWIRRSAGRTTGTVRLLDYRGKPAATGRARVIGVASQSGCGAGCVRFAFAGTPPVLFVAVAERGRTFTVALPATWSAGGARRARALLDRAQATMRALRSVRQVEDVTSGPGTFARTTYRLRAPDRLAYVTDRGVRGVTVGARQFVRVPGSPWQESPTAAGVPFRTASWFRFTPYATAVRLLGEHAAGGRRLAELALMDPGTPVWTQLTVDESSGRVLRDELVLPARNVTHRNSGFDAPVEIATPQGVVRGG
jgi:copper transport protein